MEQRLFSALRIHGPPCASWCTWLTSPAKLRRRLCRLSGPVRTVRILRIVNDYYCTVVYDTVGYSTVSILSPSTTIALRLGAGNSIAPTCLGATGYSARPWLLSSFWNLMELIVGHGSFFSTGRANPAEAQEWRRECKLPGVVC